MGLQHKYDLCYTTAKEANTMVYAYPTNATFSAKKINKTRRMTDEAKAVKEYYETHDISIVRDSATGKLVAKVTEK